MFVPVEPFQLVHCDALAYWAHPKVIKKMKCCEYDPIGGIQSTSFLS
jgi:hypothetical protein